MTKRRDIRVLCLPAAPLLAVVPKPPEARGMDWASLGGAVSILPPRLERALYRAARSGLLTYGMADELAVAFGHHPCEIWPTEWFA